MTGAQIIVLATPVFLALIALEYWVGVRRGRNTYRLNDAMSSIGLGVLSQLTGVFTKLMTVGIYAAVFAQVALWELSASSWWVWLVALVFYDFCYYWHHRFGHTVALFWAGHVVHHQSEDYNLSTALRQTSGGWLLGWVFYLPMAVLGFPPVVFATVALIDLLYQYWVHTQQIGKLGWFDRWFCAPSNHRVHHAVNDRYLDRNYGGVLIVWDRLFGTYAEEDDAERCVYGTRAPLRSWNPVRANLQVYADLARDSWRARRWSDKLRVWWKPPGWRPDDVAARWPKPPFAVAAFERFDPPVARARQVAAFALFAALLAATTWLLWNAHALPWPVQAVAALAIALGGRTALRRRAACRDEGASRDRPSVGAVNDDRLPPSLLAALAARGNSRSFRPQTILISEGDAGGSLYIVLSGRLRVFASSPEGRDVVLSEHGPGEYVGELSLEGSPRSASVKAVEATTCCVVPAAQLPEFLAEHPEFALHLTRKLTRMVRRLTEQVKSLALQDVYGRMVRLLMELSEPVGDERIVREKLTQQDIADRVGSSREMVNRVMKDLTTGGYVVVRDGRHVIQKKLPAAR